MDLKALFSKPEIHVNDLGTRRKCEFIYVGDSNEYYNDIYVIIAIPKISPEGFADYTHVGYLIEKIRDTKNNHSMDVELHGTYELFDSTEVNLYLSKDYFDSADVLFPTPLNKKFNTDKPDSGNSNLTTDPRFM